MALDDDKVVVLIGGDHHVVDFASDTEEGEVVLGVEVADETASGYGQLGEAHGVGGGLCGLAHGRPDDLGLVALLHLSFLDDD
mmetsp:Transcript_9192/g.12532  ORF Transcript_9192/g.12532 Transcript_9192/m.12532 type:complete len:83 (-) Transcript_9192:73-321(-)|eukprot:CAMPEP_0185581726 /NCGR_PEP_ID=MMETSP0434-20130131/18842_1 /TAXON_ID=626734 ORGANISM="Favella taraikaensis, Strain Fe Narragansett Bay" /NCGR_SAMPLE_ID=MMETSP0434 /ASSEMBLY_ACC=CAM_ASM_000379 /LENGTH=82 /DNA_ID=CAMNT_0028200335 /DNA_START=207 /DNA_END=455 /DNA_ORIENTATION=-